MVKPISSLQLFNRVNKSNTSEGNSGSVSNSKEIAELKKADEEIKKIAQYSADVATANTLSISTISEDVEQSKKDILELQASVKPKTEETTDTAQGQVYLKAFYQESEKPLVIASNVTAIAVMTHDQYRKIPVSYRVDLMGGIYLKITSGGVITEKSIPLFYFNNFNAFRTPYTEKISINTPEGVLEGKLRVRLGNAIYLEFERTNSVNTTLQVESKFMINVSKTV